MSGEIPNFQNIPQYAERIHPAWIVVACVLLLIIIYYDKFAAHMECHKKLFESYTCGKLCPTEIRRNQGYSTLYSRECTQHQQPQNIMPEKLNQVYANDGPVISPN